MLEILRRDFYFPICLPLCHVFSKLIPFEMAKVGVKKGRGLKKIFYLELFVRITFPFPYIQSFYRISHISYGNKQFLKKNNIVKKRCLLSTSVQTSFSLITCLNSNFNFHLLSII